MRKFDKVLNKESQIKDLKRRMRKKEFGKRKMIFNWRRRKWKMAKIKTKMKMKKMRKSRKRNKKNSKTKIGKKKIQIFS